MSFEQPFSLRLAEYEERFGELIPMLYLIGLDGDEIRRLVDEALTNGQPISVDDLLGDLKDDEHVIVL